MLKSVNARHCFSEFIGITRLKYCFSEFIGIDHRMRAFIARYHFECKNRKTCMASYFHYVGRARQSFIEVVESLLDFRLCLPRPHNVI